MALDVAMGGSTNTILHLLAAAREAGAGFGLKEIDELSRRVPCLCKVAPSSDATTWRTCTGPAASRPSWASWTAAGLLQPRRAHGAQRLAAAFLDAWDLRSPSVTAGGASSCSTPRPGGVRTTEPFSQTARWDSLDTDRADGCIRDLAARLHRRRRPGRPLRQPGPGRRDRQDRRRAGGAVAFSGPARVFESQEDAVDGILGGEVERGRRGGDPLRGAQRRPRHAGDALPDQLPQGQGPGPGLRPDHRRPVLRRHLAGCPSATSRRRRPRAG